MIRLSQNAVNELTAFFADKEKTPVRIYLAPGGCHGPRLGLALDEPTDDDHSEVADGFTFVVSKDLLEQIGGVTIDVSYFGFTVEPDKPLPVVESSGCCGSCGSCGSSGGCH
ncbi:MAG: IscA/HesB family protein [Mailhella sp.]|nr:IscA/HesB family protein [Mailhella sp.]